ncbi:hypothetical protein [Collimonas antrihumi]|uniref:hypothetical protein n=1 Tax=Collimonas antrihumi TaxID=1940615 RepID=UPI001B8B98A6|nr:hypothetical protein [Collimonas antrihumi]
MAIWTTERRFFAHVQQSQFPTFQQGGMNLLERESGKVGFGDIDSVDGHGVFNSMERSHIFGKWMLE